MFGLSVIVAISGKSIAKGMISAFFGMVLVHRRPRPDVRRQALHLRRKQTGLLSGFQFIPTLIGLFAVAEVIARR